MHSASELSNAVHNLHAHSKEITRNVYRYLLQVVCILCTRSSLYWSDVGAVAKIERSRLDGSNRVIFVSKDLDKPLGLSVDYTVRRLYWVL